MEQEEYTKEEINWSYVEFVDNQDVLDLIEKVWTHEKFNFIKLKVFCNDISVINFACLIAETWWYHSSSRRGLVSK